MSVFLGILEFIFSVIAIFFTWILILNIISSIMNTNVLYNGEKIIDKDNNARLLLALIISISWSIVMIIN